MNRGIGLPLGLALGLLLAGCELPFGEECTLIGCGPTVIVHVEGLEEAGELSALLHVEGEDAVRLVCFDNTECELPIQLHPREFTVTIEAGDTTHTRSFSPTYQTSYPNGRSCGPQCRQAEVTFTVE